MIPLVTCIIPTIPERAEWLKDAIECVMSQTHPRIEMLIDDEPGTIGEKRNRLCEKAKGEFIAHFDDDDISLPHRVADQVRTLIESGKSVTTYDSATVREIRLVRVLDSGRWRETSGWWRVAGWSSGMGCALLYRRSWWQAHRFPAVQIGEDTAFIAEAIAVGEFVVSPGGSESLCIRNHAGSTCGRTVCPGAFTEMQNGGVFHA